MIFLKKHKSEIIGTTIAILILAISLLFGGGTPSDNMEKTVYSDAKDVLSDSEPIIESSAESDGVVITSDSEVTSDSQRLSDTSVPTKDEKISEKSTEKKTPEETAPATQENNHSEINTKSTVEPVTESLAQTDAKETNPDAQTIQTEKKEEFKKEIIDITPKGTSHSPADIPDTSDSNNEDPVQSEKTEELTCTLSVRCDTILFNTTSFNLDKLDIIPKSCVIYTNDKVIFHEGETVFNVLVREMKKNKIHLEFANTPGYDSAYIEGIANIYEYDCGELSGWMYKVNDEFPNFGCSKYKLKKDDVITWVYTCDLGKDVGGEKSARNGK